jgi:hypothetical protein
MPDQHLAGWVLVVLVSVLVYIMYVLIEFGRKVTEGYFLLAAVAQAVTAAGSSCSQALRVYINSPGGQLAGQS